jgi:hypothetical protein
MSNITSLQIGQKKISVGLIPSTTYTNLTIPTITDGSGEKRFNYTAMDNGFYFIEFGANNYNGSNVGCRLDNNTRGFVSRSSILNQSHVKVVTFRFIYAIGSEPNE